MTLIKVTAAALIAFFFTLLLPACSGTRPLDLDVQPNGELKSCPDKPNCVNSFTPASDEEHAIPALDYNDSLESARARLKKIIVETERTEIIRERDDYFYAEFTTALMRYVDDVEFLFKDEEKKVHLRSASRLGHSDLGLNRERIEEIRSKF